MPSLKKISVYATTTLGFTYIYLKHVIERDKFVEKLNSEQLDSDMEFDLYEAISTVIFFALVIISQRFLR